MDVKNFNQYKQTLGAILTSDNHLNISHKTNQQSPPFEQEKINFDQFIYKQKSKFLNFKSPSKNNNEKQSPKKILEHISITEPQQFNLHHVSQHFLPVLNPSLQLIKPQFAQQNKIFDLFSFNSPSKIRINKKISLLDQTSSPHLGNRKSKNMEVTTERHLSLPSLKKIEAPCFPAGFYDCDSSMNKYKFKRSRQITISKEVFPEKKINSKQKDVPIITKSKSKNKKQFQKKKKKDNLGLLKHLREIKLQQDPEIQKLRRHSKLSVKVVQDFDNNFQQKIKEAMMKALKLKQNVYKT